MTDQNKPFYEHDCEDCQFLGSALAHDIYYCSQGGVLATIVARHGDDGPDYMSAWALVEELPPEMQKQARAMALEFSHG